MNTTGLLQYRRHCISINLPDNNNLLQLIRSLVELSITHQGGQILEVYAYLDDVRIVFTLFENDGN